jgi:hypothetical protein
MRRDLAIARERANPQKPKPATAVSAEPVAPSKDDAPPSLPAVLETVATQTPPQTDDPVLTEEAAATKAEEHVTGQDGEVTSSNTNAAQTESDEKPPSPIATEQQQPPTQPEITTKSPDPPLQLDTNPASTNIPPSKSGPSSENEDQPPDTAATNDLESLFNDPMSAGGNLADTTNAEEDPSDFTAGFDFGSFDNTGLNDNTTGDDDNDLSSLLPGVQDYANMQPTGTDQPDFDALFAADGDVAMGDGDGQGQSAEQQSFEDLLNFGDFGTGDFTTGGEQGEGNNNQDFDFNFD